jgi:hypothetical protein
MYFGNKHLKIYYVNNYYYYFIKESLYTKYLEHIKYVVVNGIRMLTTFFNSCIYV